MREVASIDELRTAASAFPPRTLGAVVFPGFQALDLWGPIEVFGDCAPAVRPLLIGPDLEPLASAQGPRVVADFTFDQAPRLELLLIPGGNVRGLTENPKNLDWIRTRAEDAELVMSVCNGADILAHAGVLTGRKATTNKALFRSISASHPDVTWIPQARWVEDGKYVTSSGVSAGIDMAFAVIARVAGQKVADAIAAYIEYERHQDPTSDPFAAIHGLAEPGSPNLGHRDERPSSSSSPHGRGAP
jgi:transcriptional regulator GlxA family with amidase domain